MGGADRRPPPRARPPDASDDSELIEGGSELVAGRRPVEEAFAARREARRLIVVPERRAALESLVLHATTLRIPVVEVEGGTLTSIAGFDGHQGVALVVAPRRWATPDEILGRAAERGEPALVLVLDSLEDPQNLGTLIRSAEAVGAHGVVFPTRRAAPLTAAAIKASAGAVEHLLLAPVDDLPGTLVDLRARGLRIVGADEEAPLTHREADLRGPLALIVGSEGQGLSTAVRRRVDLAVRIPMRGRVGSLNAAVAGSVLLFEAAGQRGLPEDRPPGARAVDAPAPAGADGAGRAERDRGASPQPDLGASADAGQPEAPAGKRTRRRREPVATATAADASPADTATATSPADTATATGDLSIDAGVPAAEPPSPDVTETPPVSDDRAGAIDGEARATHEAAGGTEEAVGPTEDAAGAPADASGGTADASGGSGAPAKRRTRAPRRTRAVDAAAPAGPAGGTDGTEAGDAAAADDDGLLPGEPPATDSA